jgi:ABC-2 type transport system ATP-binding protein
MSEQVKPILRALDLHKAFENVQAVRGVSFEVFPGEVVGFIGANGAGKTTTMRMMATLEIPDSGTVEVDGWDAAQYPDRVRRLVGWMPDAYGSYTNTTVWDYLDFFARLLDLKGSERRERVAEIVEFSGLGDLLDRPMNGLSKGMAQRLCLGRALLQKPRVLIMDEPAAGLDPKARLEFKNAVALLKKTGVTIFISSHILSELEEMCDGLLFIDEGKVVHHGSRGSLRAQNASGEAEPTVVEIRVAGSEEALAAWLRLSPGWELSDTFAGGVRAAFAGAGEEALAGELRRMVVEGLRVSGFHIQQRRLEEIFVDVLRSGKQQQQADGAH